MSLSTGSTQLRAVSQRMIQQWQALVCTAFSAGSKLKGARKMSKRKIDSLDLRDGGHEAQRRIAQAEHDKARDMYIGRLAPSWARPAGGLGTFSSINELQDAKDALDVSLSIKPSIHDGIWHYSAETQTVERTVEKKPVKIEGREDQLEQCLSFFKEVLEAGQPWTPSCQQAYDHAINFEGDD